MVVRLPVPGGVAGDIRFDGDPLHAEWLPDGRVAVTTKSGVSVTDGAKVTVLWTAPAGAATDLAIRTYR